MPTNDERREMAARLRELIKQYGIPSAERFYELLDKTLEDPSGYHSYVSVILYLADLIEPDPERTCRNINSVSCRNFICSECDGLYDKGAGEPNPNFCPECGAKVIE